MTLLEVSMRASPVNISCSNAAAAHYCAAENHWYRNPGIGPSIRIALVDLRDSQGRKLIWIAYKMNEKHSINTQQFAVAAASGKWKQYTGNTFHSLMVVS
jgi:hypothetical protein